MNKYIGKRLDGRYELKELIGIGGMADVYKAFDVSEQKTVAVKILKDEYLTNEDFKRRFRNESKAIAVLSHPNIVKIFDVSFGDRIQFIVMEYIDGITLKEYVEQQNVVNWKETVHFTVQILRALQHAHDNGIVHRDIKPQNVMLLQDGTVKVMDFGIARFARENGRTISEKAIGSVHYISPEQARGEVTDERTDIYSIGIMMFELLTGTLPFDGDSPVAIAVKQMQAQPPLPRAVNDAIPEGLEEIVIRAMKKDPDLRYQTAAEMLRDIDEFKRNPSVVFEYRYFTDDNTQYFETPDDAGDEIVLKKRMSPVMQILVAVTLAMIVMAGVALWIFFKALNNPKAEVEVDNFVGMTYDEIENNPELQNKFKFVIEKEQMSDQYEAGKVMAQTPDPGRVVKQGQKVSLTISLGLNVQTIPDVTGQNEENAVTIMQDAGFNPVVIQKYSDDIDVGLVISTNPEAGTVARKNQDVQIYISLGTKDSNDVTVPSVIGLTEQVAREMLASSNLVPAINAVESNEPKGRVVSQSIQAGQRVAPNTTVTISVSSGNAPKSDLTLTVSFRNVADQNFTFVTYMDNAEVNRQTINPARAALSVPLSGSGTGNVVILVNGQTYATYRVDFTNSKVSPASNPNNSLLAPQVASQAPPQSQAPPSQAPPPTSSKAPDPEGEEPISE